MNLSALLAAMIAVESGGDDTALGNHGEHGALQITAAVVSDCNRIANTRFTLADAHRRDVAIWMATTYLHHYAGPNATPEQYARIWNGGPGGFRKKATMRYWLKIKRKLAE